MASSSSSSSSSTSSSSSSTSTSTPSTGQFICTEPGCGKRYTTKGNLDRHISEKHSGAVNKCDKCGQKFAYSISLTKHMKTCTGVSHFLSVTRAEVVRRLRPGDWGARDRARRKLQLGIGRSCFSGEDLDMFAHPSVGCRRQRRQSPLTPTRFSARRALPNSPPRRISAATFLQSTARPPPLKSRRRLQLTLAM